jgi:hypothetical protein
VCRMLPSELKLANQPKKRRNNDRAVCRSADCDCTVALCCVCVVVVLLRCQLASVFGWHSALCHFHGAIHFMECRILNLPFSVVCDFIDFQNSGLYWLILLPLSFPDIHIPNWTLITDSCSGTLERKSQETVNFSRFQYHLT